MENKIATVHLPSSTVLQRNIDAAQNFVKNKLNDARKGVGEEISFFKEEFAQKVHKTANYISNMVLPVNNFIKDVMQIEQEFEEESKKNKEYCIKLDGKLVGFSEVMNMDMEENY